MINTIPKVRARSAHIYPLGVFAITEEIVAEIERVIAVEHARGTRLDDGTSAGQLLSRELEELDYQRAQLGNASREMHACYDPLASQ